MNPYGQEVHFILNIVWFCIFVQKSENLMNASGSEFQDLVPIGTRCLLIQPVLHVSNESDTGSQNPDGFILLASTTRYAFSNKDKAWIAAVANKYRGNSLHSIGGLFLPI